MPRVAIIKTRDRYDDYDNYHSLLESISDWVDISEEDLKNLQWAAGNYEITSKTGYFQVIVQPENTREFIANTVSAYLDLTKKQREAEEKRKAEEARKKEERRLKRLAKTEAEEKRLLETLLQKHGVPE